MDNLEKNFNAAKKLYDQQRNPTSEICNTVVASIKKLSPLKKISYGSRNGKKYSIYEVGQHKSRPFLTKLLITSPTDFISNWDKLIASVDKQNHCFQLDELSASRAIYSAVLSFAICYDLWKPKSRKTPGTYFEIVLGTLLSLLLSEASRTKFIKLPPLQDIKELVESGIDEGEQEREKIDSQEIDETVIGDSGRVSTDIVFNLPSGCGLVIPAKITTRERIVQPFAHQRILDSAFGVGKYVSLITCVSETQREDKKASVNEICVPGTIALFQTYLAKVLGIYYLDPPRRYLKLREAGVIEVNSVSHLVTGGLDEIVKRFEKAPAAPAK